jgi:anti-sigma factor RsiW
LNIKDYISSGILEAYALGDLSDLERREVEKNLAQYPELKAELMLIEETQEELLMKLSITPRTSVKEKLFVKIDQQKPEAKVVAMNTEQAGGNVWKFAAAASITLALVSSFLAYNYYGKWKSTQNDLSDLIAQNQQMRKITIMSISVLKKLKKT